MIWVFSALSDQGQPLDWGKKAVIASKNVELESLTVVNKGASAAVIQLFNLPFDPTALGAFTVSGTTDIATKASHGLETGDNITLTGSTSGTVTGYVRKIDNNTFAILDSLAHARDNSYSTLSDLAVLVGTVSGVWNSGVTGPSDLALVAEEYPIAGAAGAPSNIFSITAAKFSRGLFVRGVTALAGATLISSDDLKFTPRYRIGPIS